MKNLLLGVLFCLCSVANAQYNASPHYYGNQNQCHRYVPGQECSVGTNIPLEDQMLTVTVLEPARTFNGIAIVVMGASPDNKLYRTKYGQECNGYVKDIGLIYPVPMVNGLGSLKLFRIPKHPAFKGIHIYFQAALDKGTYEEWSTGYLISF